MNKVYKLIWNSAQHAWIVVGELSSAKGKSKTRTLTSVLRQCGIATGVLTAAMLAEPVMAWTVDPASVQNGSLVSGDEATDSGIENNTAIGMGAKTTNVAGGTATAIGNEANASDQGSTAVGARSEASGLNSSAFGLDTEATGNGSVAFGYLSRASGDFSFAVGQGAVTTAQGATAIGANNLASGNNSISIGVSTTSTNLNSTAIGAESRSEGIGATAVGALSTANGDSGTAVGTNASASAGKSTALGSFAVATGDESVALGNAANTSGLAAMALGSEAKADGEWAVAMGNLTEATGDNAVAIGPKAKATNEGATAFGSFATSSGLNALALGNFALATGEASAAIGPGAHATSNRAIAIGDTSNASGAFSVSIGPDSIAQGDNATAIGSSAQAINADDVAIGSNSVSAATVATTGTTIAGKDYQFAGVAPSSTVSIGDIGSERTLTNVAAGRLSATSTDGVNGSQLFATNSAIENLNNVSVKYDVNVDGTTNYNNITLGGDTYNNTTHTGGTTITNVADGSAPSDAVNFSQLTETNNSISNIYTTGTKYFHANSTGTDSSATALDAIAIGMSAVADVARSVALGDGAKTQAAVATDSATIAGKDYLFAGAMPVGTVSIGDAGSERTLTNVAAGRLSATSTDGVNGSQLFATNSAIENLNNVSVKYDVNVDGTTNYNNITLGGDTYNTTTHTGGTTITNVADGSAPSDAVNFSQLTETNNSINNIYTTGTKYFHANSTGTDSSATALDAVAIGMGAVASHANSVALGAGSVADGSTLGEAAYLVGGTASSEVNIGGRRITGLSAGAMDSDAVNVAQLKAVANTVTSTDNRAIKYDWVDANGDGVVQPDEVNYNHATLAGDTGTVINNLADGEVSANSSDAINGSQLFDVAGDTTNEYISKNGRGVRYVRTNDTDLAQADAFATGKASTAVGYNATASGEASIAVGQDAQASATNAIAVGKDAVASTANSVALGSEAKTSEVVATSGMTIRGDNYAVAGDNPVGTVSVGDKGQERTITNVAAGQVTASSTDAVNGSQLYATVSAINNLTIGVSEMAEAAVRYDTHVDGTVNYNKVTLAGGPTTITNVAAGTQDNDAVNYSQLKVVTEQVTNIANGTDGMFQVNNTSKLPKPSVTGTDAAAGGAGAIAKGDNSLALGTKSRAESTNSVALGANSVADRANTVSVGSAGAERQVTNVAAGTQGTDAVNVNQLKQGISNSNQYTDNKFNALKNMVDDQGDKLSAGIAGAMAMAGLPQAYQPGASMVGIAGSTYQDQSAVALGVSVISDNGKWVTKLSGSTNTQGDLGGAVGVGYQW